jgi:hypothetical protein
VRLFTEYFDEFRFPENWKSGNFARYLRDKYEGQKLDVLIGIGEGATELLRTERSALAPEAPIVFSGAIPPGDPSTANLSNSTGIYSELDIRKVLELA